MGARRDGSVEKTGSARLSGREWIDAALGLLAAGGRDAVRVEPLARLLHVTKGSFYWHFRDREALLEAVLARWEEVETLSVIDRVESEGGGARDRLGRLFRIALGRRAMALEIALRQWGESDRKVRGAVARVDRQRLGYLSDLFSEAGLPAADAAARGLLAYALLFGDFFIRVPGAKGTREGLLERATALLLAGVGSPGGAEEEVVPAAGEARGRARKGNG